MRPPTGQTSTPTLRNNIAAGSGRTIINLNGGTGAMVSSYPSDATENAIQSNITAAGYQ